MDSSQDIDMLIDEISNFSLPTPHTDEVKKDVEEIKDEDIQKYVLKQSKALIDLGVGMTQDLSQTATSSGNPDDVAALAEIMNATSKLIDTLNKSNLLDKKAEKDQKLKIMDTESKKEIAKLNASKQTTNNMNVLVASREDIMKKLFGKESDIIELTNG